MIKVPMKHMIDNEFSKYDFVVAVAKNARGIAQRAEELGETLDKKPVTLSIEQFVEGKANIGDYVEPENE